MPKPPTRDQIRRAFAQTVRSLRLKAGISQERLALNLGIDRGNTAGLERGLHSPRLYTILRLLPGLHVTFVEFADEFERSLHTKRGAGGRTTVLKRKRTRQNVRVAAVTRLRFLRIPARTPLGKRAIPALSRGSDQRPYPNVPRQY
jgi:transcriptional regulator with XRE-family HTH domain